jgi:hypothetical protein
LISKRSAIIIAEVSAATGAAGQQGLGVAKTPHPVTVYHWPFVISGSYSTPEGAQLNRSIGSQRGSFLSLTNCKITPVESSIGIGESAHAFLLVNRDLVDIIGPSEPG